MISICPYCRSQLRSSDTYCPYCSAVQSSSQSSAGNPFMGMLLIVVVILLALLLMFACSLFMLS